MHITSWQKIISILRVHSYSLSPSGFFTESRRRSLLDLPSQMTSESSALTGALGAVLGYVGSEVAQVVAFERLLWPQRYYNDLTFAGALQQGLFMTMGGPLHGAALRTLDVFRSHGLYLGAGRGKLLGTAFYPDSELKYAVLASKGGQSDSADDSARNAFWVGVVRHLDEEVLKRQRLLPRSDTETASNPSGHRRLFRAMQTVHHLKLSLVPENEDAKRTSSIREISEDIMTWKTIFNVLISELVSIAVGIASIFLGGWWMAIWMALPLVFKLLALLVSVHREGLASTSALKQKGSLESEQLFQVSQPLQGFLLVQGPEAVVTQFFCHYGHPIRHGAFSVRDNHLREVLSIALVYCFVLYFPAGLVLNIWMDEPIQYLWLGYQLYAVLAMHVVRLLDWQSCGRTERRAARYLSQRKTVWLKSAGAPTVAATIKTDIVASYTEGMKMMQDRVMAWQGFSS